MTLHIKIISSLRNRVDSIRRVVWSHEGQFVQRHAGTGQVHADVVLLAYLRTGLGDGHAEEGLGLTA
jgi:hypothetical protein